MTALELRNASNTNSYVKQKTAAFEALLACLDFDTVKVKIHRNKSNKHTIMRRTQRSCKYLCELHDEENKENG